MKNSLNKFISIGLCSAGLAWSLGGCTGTSSSATRASTSEYGSSADAAITADVAAQLVDDLGISKESVKVQTVDGIVTLTGAVEASQLKERAARIAAGVRGVHGVRNEITLMANTPPMPPMVEPPPQP